MLHTLKPASQQQALELGVGVSRGGAGGGGVGPPPPPPLTHPPEGVLEEHAPQAVHNGPEVQAAHGVLRWQCGSAAVNHLTSLHRPQPTSAHQRAAPSTHQPLPAPTCSTSSKKAARAGAMGAVSTEGSMKSRV